MPLKTLIAMLSMSVLLVFCQVQFYPGQHHLRAEQPVIWHDQLKRLTDQAGGLIRWFEHIARNFHERTHR